MAIYHLHIKNLSRGDERSAVAAAAYRAGARLWNTGENTFTDFTARGGVAHAEILAPDGAPLWARDREQLWNRAEAAEKRKDARLAKEVEIALPVDLPRSGQIDLARTFAGRLVAMGLVVDLTVHDGDDGNPHAHMLVTTRPLTAAGFGKKDRRLDGKGFLLWARKGWAEIANAALAGAGLRARIDHRTLDAQGIARAPQAHRGPDRAERKRRARERAQSAREPHPPSPAPQVARPTREKGMTKPRFIMSAYFELIMHQRRLESLQKEKESIEEMHDRVHATELIDQRSKFLVGFVKRDEIASDQAIPDQMRQKLLKLWDEQNTPRPPREGDMSSRTYIELIETQKELDELPENPGTLDEMRKRDRMAAELRARREFLLETVDREEIEAGRGLGIAAQKSLLSLWDDRNLPRPERERAPEPQAVRAPSSREERTWESMTPQAKRDAIIHGTRVEELSVEIDDLKAEFMKVSSRRLMTEATRTRELTRIISEHNERVREYWRITGRTPPKLSLEGGQDEREPPEREPQKPEEPAAEKKREDDARDKRDEDERSRDDDEEERVDPEGHDAERKRSDEDDERER